MQEKIFLYKSDTYKFCPEFDVKVGEVNFDLAGTIRVNEHVVQISLDLFYIFWYQSVPY